MQSKAVKWSVSLCEVVVWRKARPSVRTGHPAETKMLFQCHVLQRPRTTVRIVAKTFGSVLLIPIANRHLQERRTLTVANVKALLAKQSSEDGQTCF
jgi:hypothetical protein